VTVTVALVVLAPTLSVATAVNAYVPAIAGVQLVLYGLVVSVAIADPFDRNTTELTVPSLSAASAVKVTTVPGATDKPLAGAVTLTVGALLGGVTVMTTATDVVVAP